MARVKRKTNIIGGNRENWVNKLDLAIRTPDIYGEARVVEGFGRGELIIRIETGDTHRDPELPKLVDPEVSRMLHRALADKRIILGGKGDYFRVRLKYFGDKDGKDPASRRYYYELKLHKSGIVTTDDDRIAAWDASLHELANITPSQKKAFAQVANQIHRLRKPR